MNQPSNDSKIKVRSAKFGTDKKGGDTTALYIGQDQLESLVNALTALAGNERGVVLRAHIYDNESKTGNTYKAGSLFVSPVGEPQEQKPVQRFVPAAPATKTAPSRPAFQTPARAKY